MEKQARILIVDDEKVNITALRDTLKLEYMVQVAKNGLQALEIAEETLPDLILLDIVMPEMDGYEVCKRLKSNVNTLDIPIIFTTSKSEYEDELYGLQLGAVDYITKPLNPGIVKARVKTHLDLKFYREHMEKLVAERTRQLEEKSNALEETNIALRVLLNKNDKFQKNTEETVLANAKDSILPVLNKLKLEQLTNVQKIYLNTIESNLKNLIEPFEGDKKSIFCKLDPTEVKIADLIIEGKKTKEIANLLSLTIGTVKWYRDSIRKKLDLKKQKINLRNFLLSNQKK